MDVYEKPNRISRDYGGLKMVLTGLGAWILAAHQQFRLAIRGLYGFAIGYSLLLGYHLLLIVSRV
jgi:hypothetical protein